MTLLNSILQNDTVKVLVLDNHKTVFEYIKEPNTIIAILAIIVSLFGLWISVRYNRKTLEQTKRHNKLSIEPLLTVNYALSYSELNVSIEIENCGIGTAIIKKVIVSNNGKPSKDLFEIFKESNYNPDEENAEFGNFEYIFPISANSKVLVYSNKLKDSDEYSECHNFFSKINIYIEYETMYQETRIYDNLIHN